MAQRIANRFPADLNQNQALGVGLPFNGGGDAVFNSNYTTKDQTKSNLVNFFLTNKGERPFRPNFGANLRADIFQAATESDYDLLKEKISFEISQNFPNINVDSVVFFEICILFFTVCLIVSTLSNCSPSVRSKIEQFASLEIPDPFT